MANDTLRPGAVAILNIGLGPALKPGKEALGGRALRFWGPVLREVFERYQGEVAPSDTEATLVVAGRVAEPVTLAFNEAVAQSGQDCVAVWYPESGEGALVGPRADAWGAFNPEMFIKPSWLSARERQLQ
jgi:hypothetical protein